MEQQTNEFDCKKFKSLDEQVKILQSRGLVIEDDIKAKEFLYNNNYYRVSGYSLTLRNHDIFYPKTKFQNIIDIYNFDQEMRNLLLKYIEIIEIKIKSIFTYEFTKRHGGVGYLENSHFSCSDIYNTIICKANEQVEKRKSHEAYLKHFIEEIKRPIPMWAYIDLFTISDISRLYGIAENDIQTCVASEFGLKHGRAVDTMCKFLHCITIIRNLCAHGSRLYNRLFITKPSLNKYEQAILPKDDSGNPDNSRLFGFIINIKRLLSKDQFLSFKNDIMLLRHKYPFVDMKHYGFCENWSRVI